MEKFDEYQRFLRYKIGYQGLAIVFMLTFGNYLFHQFYTFQWANTQGLEMIVLIFVSLLCTGVRMVYSGAYFNKRQNGFLLSISFAVLGILSLKSAFSPYTHLVENGKITDDIITFIAGIFLLSISLAYLVKTLIEKNLEKNE